MAGRHDRTLLQWIGHSDMRALAASLPPAQRTELLDQLGGTAAPAGDLGPTKSLLAAERFTRVHLLSNYPPRWNRWFLRWLGAPATIRPVSLDNPTDYAAIFRIADEALANVQSDRRHSGGELCLHLSPGTPAMAAIWVLLGKTRYPATFYETSRDGSCRVTEIPFELIDVIPDVLQRPDAHLQHLASRSPSEIEGFEEIIGRSRAIRDAVGRAQRAAVRSVSVLLLGESGTGKEMFARAIHRAGPRRDGPFQAINCAALPKTLLESELFGHAKGAFTGADAPRAGAFEAADRGTLLLDEVGECDLETQAKLLRVLQPPPGQRSSIRRFSRLGEHRTRSVDVRIIAATNRNLHEAIAGRGFREDLYYRLAAVTIALPPLRDRRSDIPVLAEHLLEQLNRQFAAEEHGYRPRRLSASALAFARQYEWPGNVRQLHNALLQSAVFGAGPEIRREDLQSAIGAPCRPHAPRGDDRLRREDLQSAIETPAPAPIGGAANEPLGDGFELTEHLLAIQRQYLRRAMREAHGVKAEAARLLGLKNYQTLDAQLKRLGVDGDWNAG